MPEVELERRDFFKFAGGGLLLLLALDGKASAQARGSRRRAASGVGRLAAHRRRWHITVYTGKTEVGQNIRTSLAQAVAEELRAPIIEVQLVMADTDLTPLRHGNIRQPDHTVDGAANEKGGRGGA